MATTMELRADGYLPNPRTPQPSAAQTKPAVPPSIPGAGTSQQQNERSDDPKRTEIPERFMRLEPRQPTVVIDDDPVFDGRSAGVILGVSEELLKKWRQRGQGPDYIQYGKDGCVRYELTALMAYRAAHTIRARSRA